MGRSENRFESAIDPASLLRERQVLRLLPISRSSLWAGVRSGRFPQPLRLGPHTTAWRASDIFALIESLERNAAPMVKRCSSTLRKRRRR